MKIVFMLVLVALSAAVAAPRTAAEPLHANVVSVSPNAPTVGKPISLVLNLYIADRSPPHLPHGTGVAGADDVQVVLRNQGDAFRFPTRDLGGGRYSAQILFTRPGGWEVNVSYGRGDYGPGAEIPLGKGGGYVPGADAPGTASPGSDTRAWTFDVALVVAILLLAGGLLGARARVRPG